MATYTYCGNQPNNSSPTNSYFNLFGEVNSLAGSATATIITYTVPSGKKLKLKHIEAGGCNKAIYTIEKNTDVQSRKRSYYTYYDVTFDKLNIVLFEGDVLVIKVENRSSSTADFNANFIGDLQDA